MRRLKTLIIALALCCASLFANAQTSSWFADITDAVGGPQMDTVWNFRICAVDVNNDDYPDLLLEYGNMGADQLRLFINTADATGANGRKFIETTASSGINPAGRSSDMTCVADFNNDGNVDFITNVWINQCGNSTVNAMGGPRIFIGDGQGHFTMSTTSGLEGIDPEMSGSNLPALDYDRDGNLDFFCGTQFNYCTGLAGPKYLFKGNGDGTFTNASSGAGITSNNFPLFGANAADWNNDCYQDILTAPYTASGYGNLFKNNGDGTFSDVASSKGYNPHWLSGAGQPMVPWEAMPYDFDNDGDMDFLQPLVHGGTGSAGRTCIYVNSGSAGGFSLTPNKDIIVRDNPQAYSKGDHKANWMDFDNDGLVDLIISEGGYSQPEERLYFERQNSSHTFTDITDDLGWVSGSTIDPAIRGPHAVEPLDFDLDGDDDIVVGCLYSVIKDKRFLVLENKIGSQSKWIKIKLQAPTGVNKSCIGARIKVKAGGVWQMRDVYAGQGHFCGQQPFLMTFGLGTNTSIDSIIIRWPDANCTQTVVTSGIGINKTITITNTGIVAAAVIDKPENSFTIYPNPVSSDVINIESPQVFNGVVEIYNSLGQQMISLNMDKNQSRKIVVPVQSFAQGIYSVCLKNKSGETLAKQFVKIK